METYGKSPILRVLADVKAKNALPEAERVRVVSRMVEERLEQEPPLVARKPLPMDLKPGRVSLKMYYPNVNKT